MQRTKKKCVQDKEQAFRPMWNNVRLSNIHILGTLPNKKENEKESTLKICLKFPKFSERHKFQV